MAGVTASAAEMIKQLEAARKLALADPQVYNQVLPGILPIIGPAAHVEVRRWGADFLAEAFASPSLPNAQKEQLTPEVLPTLRAMLEAPDQDPEVTKSVIQAAASLYPLVFRRIISHPNESSLWQDMTSMKLNILQRMDSFPVAIRICCIKFVQKVVQVETPGLISDPRRPEQNETSIALVPRSHPLLQLQNLEAEASGLLDRLLSVFQENSIDPILVDATLNCLAILIRSRPPISTKIVSAILNFNPFKQANSPMTPRQKVIVRSMERTTRALLRWVLRTVPNHPLEQKIQAYLMRLQQSRAALFTDPTAQKRPAEPTDGLDDAKRQRLSGPRKFPPMPPPPNSVAQLFTLTEDQALQQFDVSLLPADIVSTVTALFLQHLDPHALEEAVNAVRARYSHLQKVTQPTPVPEVPMAGPTGIDDEDDYDPEFLTSGEPVVEASTEKALEELAQPAIELGPFELPKPPPVTPQDIEVLSDQTVGHVFELVASLDAAGQTHTKQKLGLNRLAASTNDRDSWITILLRLATRAPSGLDDVATALTEDSDGNNQIVKAEDRDSEERDVANRIRQTLFMYILDDFRPRLNIAISWLTEEWYADKLAAKTHPELAHLPNYSRWVNRLIDRLLPYLDARDKNLLIRFLSEIPAIDRDILDRVRTLARDPERISMCILAMQYLLMMRPPTRNIVLDAMESIWYDGDAQAKSATAKVLAKWRPGFLEQPQQSGHGQTQTKKEESGPKEEKDTESNGTKSPTGPKDPRKREA
ncbi:mRNA cleavage and polyadenylation specificity factor complex subunit pta1 [Exophiala dermatitidis]